MIVPMKKVFLLLLNSDKNEALNRLKDIGVVHLEDIKGSSDKLDVLQEEKDILQRSISILSEGNKKDTGSITYKREETLEISKRAISLNDDLKSLTDTISTTLKEIERIKVWGDFNPDDIDILRNSGVDFKFYELKKSDYKELHRDLTIFTIAQLKSTGFYITINDSSDALVDSDEVQMPKIGLNDLHVLVKEKNNIKDKIQKEIETLSNYRTAIKELLADYNDDIEFESIYSGLPVDGAVAYLQGFLPDKKTELIKNEAASNGWGIMIKEPDEDDHVPTFVQNSRVVRIIQPVFDFLGTIPGYHEKDISFFFLIFFSMFFAMIIGDGGYGALFLGISIYFGVKLKKKNGIVPDAVILLGEMSFFTVIWGAITGTWFGSEVISDMPFFNMFIIDKIASFSDKPNAQYIKHLTFIIGTVHLSIAHIWNFITLIKGKHVLKAISQLGWLSMVLGLYHLVLNFVLSSVLFPMPSYAWNMILGGLIAVVLFGEQDGNFFKGLIRGVSGLMTTSLNTIGAFSDIISYIRLFAVGLATVAVASSFNAMAAGMGTGVIGIIAGVVVLALGHTLNIGMAVLSVVVHGVRLNVLEFSGHLGMEWTGEYYDPFKNRKDI